LALKQSLKDKEMEWFGGEDPQYWGEGAEDYYLWKELEEQAPWYHPREFLQLLHSSQDRCEEIDLILRDCLEANLPENRRGHGQQDCFEESISTVESDTCWCKVCDFERAIEICRQPTLYSNCQSCQKGRTPKIWAKTSCSPQLEGARAAAHRYGVETAAEARKKAKKQKKRASNLFKGRKGHWGEGAEDYYVEKELKEQAPWYRPETLYNNYIAGDHCEEIDWILRDCLEANLPENGRGHGQPDCFDKSISTVERLFCFLYSWY